MNAKLVWITAGGIGALALAYFAGAHRSGPPSSLYTPGAGSYSTGSRSADGGTAFPPAAAGLASAQETRNPPPAAASRGLDEQTVRSYVEQHVRPGTYQITGWRGVQIGPPAQMGSVPLEIPENSIVYPAELSYTGATIGSNLWRRDYHQRWYYYRDPTSGQWAGQLVQDLGTSDAY